MLVELERLNELQASTTAFRTNETNSNGRPNSFISVNSSTSEVVEEIECLAQEPGLYNYDVDLQLQDDSSSLNPSPNSACVIAHLSIHPSSKSALSSHCLLKICIFLMSQISSYPTKFLFF